MGAKHDMRKTDAERHADNVVNELIRMEFRLQRPPSEVQIDQVKGLRKRIDTYLGGLEAARIKVAMKLAGPTTTTETAPD